jgi:hypothetical protein
MKTSKYHNRISINPLFLVIMAIALGFSTQSSAQSEDKNRLLQMTDEDRTTIDAIAGYDTKIQGHILQVAKTPEVLNRIELMQKRSQNQFWMIIENYDRDAQTAFYDFARYPNLITELVSNGKPSFTDINRILLNYPEDIHATTKKYARMYFDVLQRIDQLNNETDKTFQLYLQPYDQRTRESVNILLSYPEIVSSLVEDKPFTTLLGEVYREDPEWVEHRLDQISHDLAVQNKEDLDAYKNQVLNDPEAYNEMLKASERFARENNQERYLERNSDPVIEVHLVNSYPYWFGCPYWYSYPYWRPRPLYYHTGFYKNRFGSIIFVGLPSFHFIHWQTFYHPTVYPHLSYNYYSFYEHHYKNHYQGNIHPIPHYGFYRSIEANVIYNPRVNNANLERIDHQRGNSIVHRPNNMQSGYSRQNNSGNSRYNNQLSNPRQASKTNSNVSRRQYNTTSPGRSEGSYTRSSGTLRKEASSGAASTPAKRESKSTDNQPSTKVKASESKATEKQSKKTKSRRR